MIDGLVEIAERLTVPRIHPVVHRRAQVKPLPWYIVPRQLGLLAVVYPHVSIDVERQAGSLPGCLLANPLFPQNRVPACCPARLGTQPLQFLAQRPHFRHPIQNAKPEACPAACWPIHSFPKTAFQRAARPGSAHSRFSFSRNVRTSGTRSNPSRFPHSPAAA